MAVQKSRKTPSKRGMRRSHDHLKAPTLSEEPSTFGYMDIYNYWRASEVGRPLKRHAVGDDAGEEFGIILPDGSDWTPVMEDYFQTREGFLGTPEYRNLLELHLGRELAGLLSG
jgi:putative glutamine transport system substrate-binding protein